MAEKITKQEAVRRALDQLGPEAKPTQMQGWIKDQFNIEMGRDHISTAKGDILRKAGKKRKSRGKRPPAQKSAARKAEAGKPAAPKPPRAPSVRGGHAIPLEDVLAVKDLVVRLGPGPLRTLIDAFAG
jgi:hypothetical protein